MACRDCHPLPKTLFDNSELHQLATMPKLKITTRTRLAAIMPVAVAGGYTIERIAKECGCGRKAASSAVGAYRVDTEKAAALDGGRAADEMRAGASRERKATMGRVEKMGQLSDDILAEVGAILCKPVRTESNAGGVLGGAEGQGSGRGDSLAELERMADLLLKATKTVEVGWNLFRSASGLEMAERLTEVKARAAIKHKGKAVESEAWEADFTLIPVEA